MIKLKNVYDFPSLDDGRRILIERLWPVDVDVYGNKIDFWLKDLAPSYASYEWLREHGKEFSRFKEKYLKELLGSDKKRLLRTLFLGAKQESLTFLYRNDDVERSPAKMIYEVFKNFKE